MSAHIKADIRREIRTRRAGVDAIVQRMSAHAAAAHLIQHAIFQASQSIAVYLPVNNELDCTPLIHAVWQANKTCYLPLLVDDQMHFAAFTSDTTCAPNHFGIPQPVNTERILPQALDLIIAPLVAYDLQGHRLGMGGGYYDRTLAFLLNAKCSKPIFLGYAYSFQQVESVPTDAWDVPLNGVVTETGVLL